MDEKRAVLRRRTYLAAQMSSPEGIVWAQGVVRNLGQGGAMIEAAGAALPDFLHLAAPMAGLRTPARVVWREGARAGLQFIAPAAPAPARRPLHPPHDDDPNY